MGYRVRDEQHGIYVYVYEETGDGLCFVRTNDERYCSTRINDVRVTMLPALNRALFSSTKKLIISSIQQRLHLLDLSHCFKPAVSLNYETLTQHMNI